MSIFSCNHVSLASNSSPTPSLAEQSQDVLRSVGVRKRIAAQCDGPNATGPVRQPVRSRLKRLPKNSRSGRSLPRRSSGLWSSQVPFPLLRIVTTTIRTGVPAHLFTPKAGFYSGVVPQTRHFPTFAGPKNGKSAGRRCPPAQRFSRSSPRVTSVRWLSPIRGRRAPNPRLSRRLTLATMGRADRPDSCPGRRRRS